MDKDLSRSFKVCRKTSLLALAPACLVIGLHHVVMEAQEQEAASILLTGYKKTLGQVVSGFPLQRTFCEKTTLFSGPCRAFNLVARWTWW